MRDSTPSALRSSPHPALLWAVLLALVLGWLELASCAYLHRVERREGVRPLVEYTVEPAYLAQMRARYSASLGWVPDPAKVDAVRGHRPNRARFGRDAIAVFGDSFTWGGVWTNALSKRLGANVLNFGVGGYGTDQALLRMRERLPALDVSIVLLQLIPENLNRVHSTYRKFYLHPTGLPYTKPRFRLVEGGLELLPNPVPDADALERLADPAFIAELAEEDLHYQRRRNATRFGFPYLLSGLDAARGFATRARRVGLREALDERLLTLWEVPPARDLLFAILRAFAAEVDETGRVPVVVLLPSREDLRELLRDGDVPARRHLARFCRDQALRCFDGVTRLADHVAQGATLEELFASDGFHLSRRGQRQVAADLYAFLERQELLERIRVEPPLTQTGSTR